MSKITVGAAEAIVPVARSPFRKHIKSGKISVNKKALGQLEV